MAQAPEAAPISPDQPSVRPKPKRGYLVPGVIALVVCAGLATLIDVFGLQTHTPDRLPGAQTELFLAQALQAQRHLSAPPAVTCPRTEELRPGVAFTCTAVLAGRTHRVEVSEGTGGSLGFRVGP